MKLLIVSSASSVFRSAAISIFAGSILFSLSIARGQNLFLSDYGNGTVEEFTPNGSDKIVATGLNEPMGIAFD
jgi:hypothetical protein